MVFKGGRHDQGDGPGGPQGDDDDGAGAGDASDPARGGLTRRHFLGGVGMLGAGVAAGAVVGGVAAAAVTDAVVGGNRSDDNGDSTSTVAFYGPHQAGIATPAQDRLAFGALTVVDGTDPKDLADLLRQWTVAAAKMTQGKLVGNSSDLDAPPLDTGEAVGSPPSNLTVTIGYGPSLFDDRFGLAKKKPLLLRELPALPNEDLDPDYTGGDLCIQACSDNPLVAFHAVRNLARLGMGVVEHDWMQLGFGRTSTTSTSQSTPRNLLGFKDGTRNILGEDTDLMDKFVWVGSETDQPWMRGGSYMVARRIRILVENWDRDILSDQENVIGRAKTSGAPLTGGGEFTTPDFGAKGPDGPVIPDDAHIRLASFEQNGGIRILRRGYSFTDGIDPVTGTLLGGLFFISFQKDPQQFIALQQKLGNQDALNEYIHHIGSGIFACPAGVAQGQHWGDGLFT